MTPYPFSIQLERIQEPYKNFVLRYDYAAYQAKGFCDLYWLCHANDLLKDDYQYTKGILVFLFMLENWKKRLAAASAERSVFLPFDFSDEYLAGFVVWANDAHTLRVSYQASIDMSGWSHYATQLESMAPQELLSIMPPHEVPRALFEEAIDASRYQILQALTHLSPLSE